MQKLVGSLVGCWWLLACGGNDAATPEVGSPSVEASKGAAGGTLAGKPGAPSGATPGVGGTTSTLPAGTCVSLAASLGDALRVATIALDTGVVTLGASVTLPGDGAYDVTSLGLVDDMLYACLGKAGLEDGTLHTIQRASGAVVSANVACSAATTDASGLWVMTGGGTPSLIRYANLASAQAKQTSTTFPIASVESIGPGKDTLYGAWHSAAQILRIDRATGQSSPLVLEGFNGWIFGLSSASGDRVVISTPSDLGGEGVLAVFDGKTGKRIGRVGTAEANSTFRGVVCSDAGGSATPTKLPSEPR